MRYSSLIVDDVVTDSTYTMAENFENVLAMTIEREIDKSFMSLRNEPSVMMKAPLYEIADLLWYAGLYEDYDRVVAAIMLSMSISWGSHTEIKARGVKQWGDVDRAKTRSVFKMSTPAEFVLRVHGYDTQQPFRPKQHVNTQHNFYGQSPVLKLADWKGTFGTSE